MNFASFEDEIRVQVVGTSFGDADAANSHFSGIFLSFVFESLTFQKCC